MSAAPLIQPYARQPERRYWLDEGSLQWLLDLMFCFIGGDRANGTEEHLGWTISWETQFEPRLFLRGEGNEFLSIPAGYRAQILAPGLVTDSSVERILSYLDSQGLSAVAYEQAVTSFEFCIGA